MVDQIHRLLRQRKAMFGLVVLTAFVLLAMFGPWLVVDPTLSVGTPYQPPSWAHWFGTTGQGQDVLAQAVVGTRTTLLIALTVGVLVTLIGVLVGTTAGYFGGVTDDVLSVLMNVFLVIPGLPLAIVLAAYLPPGVSSLIGVLVIAGWAWNARVFRSEALSLRKRDFIAAAIVSGEGHMRIILRELLPNMASLVVSAFIGTTIYALGAQVGLEFLGLGDLGAVTWGTNLYWAANDATLLTGSWWVIAPTGLCVALVGFALTLVSFAIDEVTNPRLRRIRKPKSFERRTAGTPTGPVRADVVLAVDDLCIDYLGEAGTTLVRAVDGVSFEIFPGEIFGLAGESGSGKSTIGHALLRLADDVSIIRAREFRVAGQAVSELDDRGLAAFRWRDAAMVFQSAMDCLNPVLTIREQLVDVMRAHGVTAPHAEQRAKELLALVGLLPEHLESYAYMLSGGMRQRVAIAIALALKPRLLIMDEPTTALDVVVQKEILERIVALKAELDFAILFISHDLPLMLAFADRVGVLRDGKLVEVGAASSLLTRAKHPYTRKLLTSFPRIAVHTLPAEHEETSSRSSGARELAAKDVTKPVLEARGLCKAFGRTGLFGAQKQQVLSNVSFRIARGEVLALVGQSGSGKSTIAKLLLGLELIDSGDVLLDGAPSLTRSLGGIPLAYRRRVQMVFQDPFASLNPAHTILHHIARPLLRHKRCPRSELRETATKVLEQVGLKPGEAYLDRFPHALSGGQRQRVAIARALAVQPDVLLADEPTSMLDVSMRKEVLALLKQLAQERGIAVLFITHDLASAAELADRIVVLHGGKVVEEGPAQQIVGRPAHPYTQLLISSVLQTHAWLNSEPPPASDQEGVLSV